jgi:PTH1 family peptidyl-tRNA hydrolase
LQYAHTRHNVGADAIELLAARHGLGLRHERGTSAIEAVGTVGGRRVCLAIPETYMNESGIAAAALARRHTAGGASEVVVVHDELDLPVGTVRVKRGGGTAGHNGLKSVHAHLRSLDFLRVRIGIGRPPGRMPGADYVLRRPGKDELDLLGPALEEAADAVELILSAGVDAAMNAVNSR